MKKLLAIIAILATPVYAATVQLAAEARSNIPNDEMSVVLAVERSGTDMREPNDTVLGLLNKALEEAKRHNRVKSQMGSIATQPLWVDGKASGWQVHGDIVLVSQDFPALSELASRLSQFMQIGSVRFQLSVGKRKSEETRLISEVADNFHARAKSLTSALGFQKYTLRELMLSNSSNLPGPRPRTLGTAAPMAMSAATVPIEAGESSVVLTLSGTVEF